MATYECGKCGMAVNTTCAKCDVPLVDASLEIGDGKSVQIAKCPSCEGKIKSPSCCGEEMACNIQLLMKLNTANSAKLQDTFHHVIAS